MFKKKRPQGKKQRAFIIDIVKFLLFMALFGWLIVRGAENLGYHWHWGRVPRFILSVKEGKIILGPLMEGLLVTFRITGVSLVFAMALGLTTALLRLSDSILGRFTARVYLELVRNTPLLVQLFFIYFVLGPVLELERFTAAVLALSLFEGAYASEIFRSGILSVHRGQWEAARSLGMNTVGLYRHVVLPQAVARMLPPLTSQSISLIKDSALVSTIAIYDLTMQGQAIIAETYLTFELWITIAMIYLVVSGALSFLVGAMKRRLGLSIEPTAL